MTSTRDDANGSSGGGSADRRTDRRDAAGAEIRRITSCLLARQDQRGAWRGPPAGTGCAGIDQLLTREFLGVAIGGAATATAGAIRSQQLSDGSWPGCLAAGCAALPGIGSDGSCALSATVRAYLALRLAGDPPDAYHMALAAGWIRDAGGIGAAPTAARVWLAMFGITGWEDLGVPVPELFYAPAWCRTRAAGWAGLPKPAVAAVAVIGALRPSRRVAFGLPELQVPAAAGRRPMAAGRRTGDAGKTTARMSARLLAVGKPALSALPSARTAALRRCADCVADGRADSAWSVIALHLLADPARPPVPARGGPAAARGGQRAGAVAGPCVRQSALAVAVLAEAGLPADHPALASAADWLLSRRVAGRARWPGSPADLAPVGWSYDGSGQASAGDTAGVVLALCRASSSRATLAGPREGTQSRNLVRRSVAQAASWLAREQRRDGGWSRVATQAGLGEAGLPASAAVTAAAVHALAAAGPPGCRAIRRGVAWLLRSQLADGSWPGAGTEVMVTQAALQGLIAAGVLPGKPAVSQAVGWLSRNQNLDGGWGEHRGALSTVPATSRALSALLAAGGGEVTDSALRAASWLWRALRSGDSSEADCIGLLTRLDALTTWLRADQTAIGQRGDRGTVGQ